MPDFLVGTKAAQLSTLHITKVIAFRSYHRFFLVHFFAFAFRSFRPRFSVEHFPSFHPCFAPFRAFAFLPAMTSDDTL